MSRVHQKNATFTLVYPLQNGMRVRHQAATCCKCGHTEAIRDGGSEKMKPPGHIANKLRERGWELGQTRASDVCPTCIALKHPRKKRREPAPVVYIDAAEYEAAPPAEEETEMAQPAAEPPRQPTIHDNRKIAAALAAAYLVDKGCYRGSNSDAALADALKLPRAWVTALRASLYGAGDTNEAASVRVAELGALKGQAKKLEEDAMDMAQRASDLQAQIDRVLGQ